MYADTSNFVSEFVVVLLASSTVRAFGGALPPPRSGRLTTASVSLSRHSADPPHLTPSGIYHPGP
jgi:hypothetical protein